MNSSQSNVKCSLHVHFHFAVGLNEGWTKRRQALPSGHMINDATVTSSGSAYTIELTPNECGNNFHVFKVKDGQVKSIKIHSTSIPNYRYGVFNMATSVVRW